MKIIILLMLVTTASFAQHTGTSGGPDGGMDEHKHGVCNAIRKDMVLEYKNNLSGKRVVVFKKRMLGTDYKKFKQFLAESVAFYTEFLKPEPLIFEPPQCLGSEQFVDDFNPTPVSPYEGQFTNLISMLSEFRFHSCHNFEAADGLNDPEETDTYIEVLKGLNGDLSDSDL